MEHSAYIFSMIAGSGPVVTMVLLTLVVFSLACWAIITVKSLRLRQAARLDRDFSELFWQSKNFEQVKSNAESMLASPIAVIFLAGNEELGRLRSEFSKCQSPVPISVWLETLERSLDKAVKQEMASLNNTIPILATIGNSAPFIGLFGTVWGILSSFQSIGVKGSASLATVAPGISEALVATAAGLAAAIPAVMAFNTFMSSLENVEIRLRGFTGDFLNSVERQLAASGKR